MGWMRSQYNPKRHKLYVPTNIEKYRGNVPIVMRSGLELKFAQWCDKTSSVLEWSNENLAIPYLHPVKKDKLGNRKRVNYYPDFQIVVATTNGNKVIVVEIKHEKDTVAPKVSNRKSLLNEQVAYTINLAKWQACYNFCTKYGWDFKIITNKTLDTLR
jgi:hypothetical protein